MFLFDRLRLGVGVTHLGLVRLEDGYDDAEETDGAAEDFDDEDLDEEGGVLGIGQRSPGAHDADAEAAEQVGHSYRQAGSEHGVTSKDIISKESSLFLFRCGFTDVKTLKVITDHNGHDDPIDGDGFAEDDADEVLGSDARRLDATAQDTGASRIDTPCSSND